MTDPNFFIVGAPKCGTTSMASWLREHENVFLPELKEPEYFNADHKRRRILSERRYHDLFRRASPGLHTAVGEASVWYLYSDVAVERIVDTCGRNTKFIVMLRNPLNMAVSLHQHKVYFNFEHIRDFEKAWCAQDARRAGRQVATDAEPSQLVYGEACKLGAQLQRLTETTGAANVLPILLSDLRSDPGQAYRDVLDFLSLKDDGRTQFPALNQAKTYKSEWFHNAVQCAARLKGRVGIQYNFNLHRFNRKPAQKPALSPSLRDEMKDYFRDDVALLSRLLDRDLMHWVN